MYISASCRSAHAVYHALLSAAFVHRLLKGTRRSGSTPPTSSQPASRKSSKRPTRSGACASLSLTHQSSSFPRPHLFFFGSWIGHVKVVLVQNPGCRSLTCMDECMGESCMDESCMDGRVSHGEHSEEHPGLGAEWGLTPQPRPVLVSRFSCFLFLLVSSFLLFSLVLLFSFFPSQVVVLLDGGGAVLVLLVRSAGLRGCCGAQRARPGLLLHLRPPQPAARRGPRPRAPLSVRPA